MDRRCAWCPKRPEAKRAARPASHGICAPCLDAELRAERGGFVRSGARFLVWDEDAVAGAAWSAELAALDAGLDERIRRADAHG